MPDLEQIIGTLAEKFAASGEALQKVKFGSGAVSKLVLFGIAVVVALAIAAKYSTQTGALIVAFLIVFVFVGLVAVIVVLVFKKPELAALEGMELVAYSQVTRVGMKGQEVEQLRPIPDPTPLPPSGEASKDDAQ